MERTSAMITIFLYLVAGTWPRIENGPTDAMELPSETAQREVMNIQRLEFVPSMGPVRTICVDLALDFAAWAQRQTRPIRRAVYLAWRLAAIAYNIREIADGFSRVVHQAEDPEVLKELSMHIEWLEEMEKRFVRWRDLLSGYMDKGTMRVLGKMIYDCDSLIRKCRKRQEQDDEVAATLAYPSPLHDREAILVIITRFRTRLRSLAGTFMPVFWVAMLLFPAVLVVGVVVLYESTQAGRGLSASGALGIGAIIGSLHVLCLILSDLDYWRWHDGEEQAARITG